ncbi:DUF2946 family protein [Castellaniella sp.]|uniref:DUF2946 family protein n=1 Tax=Castellaniella sp. TaxID=1955812 RepID=UPI003C74EA14
MGSAAYRCSRSVPSAWVWALCLAWALRALVPAGYMPNLMGAAGGWTPVILCGALSQASHDLPLHGDPAGHFETNHCPLCPAFSHGGDAPLPSQAPSLPAVLLGTVLALVRTADQPSLAYRCGAPLGSRAPPLQA